MAHILKNNNVEIHIDLPLENYNFSRFDWTGKITKVFYKKIPLSTIERKDHVNEHHFGKGFYNEFGIDTALGFEEAEIGSWFHKIGVGLLKKGVNQYDFQKDYEIKPANFSTIFDKNKITIICTSESVNGYSYILKKEIQLHKNSFSIHYFLENTGKKDIITDEYVHNFTAINNNDIDNDCILKFPFSLNVNQFDEVVNPEQKVIIKEKEFTFKETPNDPFFFSDLSGSKSVEASWELINLKKGIVLSESTSFKTNKINIWGWKHVISPELFHKINIKSGQSSKWSRVFFVSEI